jgi:hypothetical protein
MQKATLNIATGNSHRHPVQARSISWSSFCESLKQVAIGSKEGRGWVAANIPDGPRTNARVISTSLLVFDIDNKGSVVSQSMLKKAVMDNGYRAILHSTYNHTKDKPRFRLILDISKQIQPSDHKSLLLYVAQHMGLRDFIDMACVDLSRYFYQPRCPENRVRDYVFWSNDGDPVNVKACLDRINLDQKPLESKPSAALDSSVSTRDETEFNIAEIKEFLGYCSADCEYGKWRNIIWSVSSLGWDITPSLLMDWSKTSLRHWSEETAQQAETTLTNLMNEFDPERGITIGTLIAEAKMNGWTQRSLFNVLSDSDEARVNSIDPLEALQQRFCIIDLNGEVKVLSREQITSALSGVDDKPISFYKKLDGELMMRRCLEALPVSSKPRQIIASFWVEPATIVYEQIAFTPNKTPPTTLNFWIGHTACAKASENTLIQDYLLEVICNGNKGCYDYLVRFLAHMLQFPEVKPGIVPVLIGGQGTGKGVFFQLLRAIWSKTTLLVSDINEVVGQFNAGLERNYIVCMDEALFAGDRRSQDRLKSLVTEPTIRIEQKYQPSRSIESVHRFFAATNHDQFAHIEKDDRRFLMLRVSSLRQQDTDYFEKLCRSFDDGITLEGFVAFLLKLDLTGFNIRQRPVTTEHSNQKLKSLTGFDRYWYEVLVKGNFGAGEPYSQEEWDVGRFISTNRIKHLYKDYDPKAGRYEGIQEGYISQSVKRLCPTVESKRRLLDREQARGFEMPCIQIARSEFESHFNISINWDE